MHNREIRASDYVDNILMLPKKLIFDPIMYITGSVAGITYSLAATILQNNACNEAANKNLQATANLLFIPANGILSALNPRTNADNCKQLFEPEFFSDAVDYARKRDTNWFLGRAAVLGAAVATVVIKLALLIVGIASFCFSLTLLGQWTSANNFSLKHLKNADCIRDLFNGIKLTANPNLSYSDRSPRLFGVAFG